MSHAATRARAFAAVALLLLATSPVSGAPSAASLQRLAVSSPAGDETVRPGAASTTASTATQPTVPGELVAILHPDAALEAFASDAAERGYHTLGTIPQLAAIHLAVPIGHEERAVAELRADPRVVHAEPHAVGRALFVPDDTNYRDFQWNLRKINIEPVWDVTTGSPDVVVAVLDTGVDAGHPDLAGNVLPGYDFVNDDPDATDDSSHGTFIAGVIAAAGNNGEGIAGLAWRTRILPVKVLDGQGLGPDAAVSKGIIFAVENRARVINLSSGTPFPSRLLEESIRFAERRGAVVVASAGNTGDRSNEAIYPAAYSTVLAVAATDEQDDVPVFSQRQPYVGVAAPGVGIVGTGSRAAGNGPYILHSGTSAAAPHVAGLAALMLAVRPDLTPPEIREAIRDTADLVGPEPRRTTVGAGRINAARTIARLRPSQPPASGVAAAPAVPTAVARAVLPTLRALPQPGPLPAEPLSWFFAEGNTLPGWDTWLSLQNPLAQPATVRVRYMTQDGLAAEETVQVAPNGRESVHVNRAVPNALVSAQVDASTTVFAERSVYFGHDGIGGVGARSPGRSWHLAEGSTQPPFDTWIALYNPNLGAANARLTFMLDGGERVAVDQPLAPQSRVSLNANDILPPIGFSTTVTSDVPIVVERSMYFADGGGHGSIGVKTPGRVWFLAEGNTTPGFDTWILLQNPSPIVANVQLTFLREDGAPTLAYYALDPNSRLSLFADTVVPNATFGLRIDADQPIIAERSLYVAGGQGGHNSAAVALPTTEWYLPEGSTRGPYRQVLAFLNPNPEPTQVDVTFTRSGGQPPITQIYLLQPASRHTVDVAQIVADAEVSTRVIADKPVVVERSMYFDRGATNAPGLPR